MKNFFTTHPKSVGETYFQHLRFALSTGLRLILMGFVAVIHGILPFTFQNYVSIRIKALYHEITTR